MCCLIARLLSTAMRALIGLLLVICAGASAQTFPQRPVRIVIGFPPGGGIDTVARFLAPKMSETLGQPVVVDNRTGGEVQTTFEAVTIGLPHVQAGKLRALATTAAKRLPMLPDMPAVAETLPGYEVDNWYGMVVPAGTPRAVVRRLRDEVA